MTGATVAERDAGAPYRVCVVTGAHTVGGAEVFLQYLLGALPPAVDVTVLGASPAVLTGAVHRRPRSRTEVVSGGVPRWARALREHRPDVVHVNRAALTSSRDALLAARLLRLPTVVVDHLPETGLSWRGRSVQRAVTTGRVTNVAVSVTAARLVEECAGLRPGSVVTIPNGVPAPPPAPATARREPKVLGVLARLEHQKGIDVALEALRAVPGARLDIAGEGSLSAELLDLAATLGVADRVRFRGRAGHPHELLHEVDALVLPSRHEAMPLSLLEAMRAGVPVVATAVGGVPEIVVDGRTGLLVPPGDPARLAHACRRVLGDDALRARLSAQARAVADAGHSDTVMATAYDRLYRSVSQRRA
ncbi:glycosyltransferase [Kineococcus sp. R8]|uniref:glycosyltransferase n=1 Tax=Kineococcus siccus TaxID=2696567 RepID=UPI0014134EB3|nr:glycosyltransferase [Kineococcus siccus]